MRTTLLIFHPKMIKQLMIFNDSVSYQDKTSKILMMTSVCVTLERFSIRLHFVYEDLVTGEFTLCFCFYVYLIR